MGGVIHEGRFVKYFVSFDVCQRIAFAIVWTEEYLD